MGESYFRIISAVVIAVLFFIYVWLFLDFLQGRFLWSLLVLFLFVYVMFFVAYDYYLKDRELNEKLRIKDRKEIRIGFLG